LPLKTLLYVENHSYHTLFMQEKKVSGVFHSQKCGNINLSLPNISLVAGHLTTVRTEGVGQPRPCLGCLFFNLFVFLTIDRTCNASLKKQSNQKTCKDDSNPPNVRTHRIIQPFFQKQALIGLTKDLALPFPIYLPDPLTGGKAEQKSEVRQK
jgi:hypothetical protein